MKKHIIAIAGRPGAGKSATATAVAKRLGYAHYSSGDFFRALAKERGVELLQANLTAEEGFEIDHLVDTKLQEIGQREDNLVIDARTAWHWIEGSFKVFLDLDLEVAAKRIIYKLEHRAEANETIPHDPKEYAKVLAHRLASENRRYKSQYGIDLSDMSNFDLVVDTNDNSLEEVVQCIIEAFTAWQDK